MAKFEQAAQDAEAGACAVETAARASSQVRKKLQTLLFGLSGVCCTQPAWANRASPFNMPCFSLLCHPLEPCLVQTKLMSLRRDCTWLQVLAQQLQHADSALMALRTRCDTRASAARTSALRTRSSTLDGEVAAAEGRLQVMLGLGGCAALSAADLPLVCTFCGYLLQADWQVPVTRAPAELCGCNRTSVMSLIACAHVAGGA